MEYIWTRCTWSVWRIGCGSSEGFPWGRLMTTGSWPKNYSRGDIGGSCDRCMRCPCSPSASNDGRDDATVLRRPAPAFNLPKGLSVPATRLRSRMGGARFGHLEGEHRIQAGPLDALASLGFKQNPN